MEKDLAQNVRLRYKTYDDEFSVVHETESSNSSFSWNRSAI